MKTTEKRTRHIILDKGVDRVAVIYFSERDANEEGKRLRGKHVKAILEEVVV